MRKLTCLCGLALSLTVTCAFAQSNSMTSGRPSAVLTPDQCAQVWAKAVPSGDFLTEANAAPYIVNFKQLQASRWTRPGWKDFQERVQSGLRYSANPPRAVSTIPANRRRFSKLS
jgi:hypothetical protein